MKAMTLIAIAGLFCVATVAMAQDLAVDDFERAAGSLGPNWTVYNGSPGIFNGSFGAGSVGLNLATWSASSFDADQYAEILLTDPLETTQVQVFCRRRVSDRARYGFVWVSDQYQACISQIPTWPGGFILKLDGLVGAPTLSCVGDSDPPVGGDVLRIECESDQIRGHHNGVLKVQTADTSLSQAGEPGIAMAPRAPNRVGVEMFKAGSLPTPEAASRLQTQQAQHFPTVERVLP